MRRVLDSLIEVTPQDSIPRARLLWVAAAMATSQNDYEASSARSLESLRIGTLLKDVNVVGWSLIYVTIARWFAGDLAEATRLSQSALSLARLMQMSQLELAALNFLAYVLLASGELDPQSNSAARVLRAARPAVSFGSAPCCSMSCRRPVGSEANGDARRPRPRKAPLVITRSMTGLALRSFSRHLHGWRRSRLHTSAQPCSSGLLSARERRVPSPWLSRSGRNTRNQWRSPSKGLARSRLTLRSPGAGR